MPVLCPTCSTSYPEGARFCGNCGSSLEASGVTGIDELVANLSKEKRRKPLSDIPPPTVRPEPPAPAISSEAPAAEAGPSGREDSPGEQGRPSPAPHRADSVRPVDPSPPPGRATRPGKRASPPPETPAPAPVVPTLAVRPPAQASLRFRLARTLRGLSWALGAMLAAALTEAAWSLRAESPAVAAGLGIVVLLTAGLGAWSRSSRIVLLLPSLGLAVAALLPSWLPGSVPFQGLLLGVGQERLTLCALMAAGATAILELMATPRLHVSLKALLVPLGAYGTLAIPVFLMRPSNGLDAYIGSAPLPEPYEWLGPSVVLLNVFLVLAACQAFLEVFHHVHRRQTSESLVALVALILFVLVSRHGVQLHQERARPSLAIVVDVVVHRAGRFLHDALGLPLMIPGGPATAPGPSGGAGEGVP